jgi:hypothetical protein
LALASDLAHKANIAALQQSGAIVAVNCSLIERVG